MAVKKQDNQHFAFKVALRERAIQEARLPGLDVCETHGGRGHLYRACYASARRGLVIEHDPERSTLLAWQRPTWQVYEGDAAALLTAGIGDDVPWTLLDCDPWGTPWPTLVGFFGSRRPCASSMVVVATDGSRQKQRLGGIVYGWEPWQEQYGAGLWHIYLRCSRERFAALIEGAGYVVQWWHGRYGGHTGQMTYWAAVLRQPEGMHSDAAQQDSGG